MQRIAIIGAGITGLAFAYYAERVGKVGLTIDLFESESEAGGKIRTTREGGFIIEHGPDAFVITKPAFLSLIRDLGLEHEVVSARSYPAYILTSRGLTRLPTGLLGPNPLTLNSVTILKGLPLREWIRVIRGVLWPGSLKGDCSVKDLGYQLFGRTFTEYILEPLLAGLYGGKIEQLSARMALPFLVRDLEQPRPFWKRVVWRTPPRREGSIFRTIRNGLDRVVHTLMMHLKRTQIHFNSPVVSIRPVDDCWWVDLSDGRSMGPFDRVVCTLPPRQAVRIIPEEWVTLRQILHGIEAPPVATIVYAFPGEVSFESTGLLVPRLIHPYVTAFTFVSQKWPGRAPEGYGLIRAFIGRGAIEEWWEKSDEQLASEVWQWLTPRLPLKTAYDRFWIMRWRHGIPVYPVGHRENMRKMKDWLHQEAAGIAFIGSGYDGVGMADCVRQAKELVAAWYHPVKESSGAGVSV